MNTSPDATPMEWAASMSSAELAKQVRRLAQDVHCLGAEERRAVLTIVADDLTGGERD